MAELGKFPRTLWLMVVLFYAFSFLYPAVAILYNPPMDKIDPEIVNGLLTASSIVFGFLAVLVQPYLGKEAFRRIFIFIVVPLAILVFSAAEVFDAGLRASYQVWALYGSMVSFLTNILTVVILLVTHIPRIAR